MAVANIHGQPAPDQQQLTLRSTWFFGRPCLTSLKFWLTGIGFLVLYLAFNKLMQWYQFDGLGITLWSPDNGCFHMRWRYGRALRCVTEHPWTYPATISITSPAQSSAKPARTPRQPPWQPSPASSATGSLPEATASPLPRPSTPPINSPHGMRETKERQTILAPTIQPRPPEVADRQINLADEDRTIRSYA